MANLSKQKKLAVQTAMELLANPKLKAGLRAQLTELITKAEMQREQFAAEKRRQKHEMKLAELKAAQSAADLEAVIGQVIDRKIQEAKRERERG